ncbi:MAG: hypothetical protein AABX60_00875, partial [Nanoarchaeota archaeon]
SAEVELLLKESEEKSLELKRLEKTLFNEQKLNKSLQARLREQMGEMASQIEGLKSFIIVKEKLVQNLESAFEKRLAAKEEEQRRLKGAIHAKPETRLHNVVDELKSELHVKEETARLMAEDVAKLKEQSALLRKRLEERQRIFFESEKAYEELIANLREQHEVRVKALVQESSKKEAALKVAIEEERTMIQQEMVLMKEKEKQVEETLHAFAITSQQLIKLQGTGQPGEAATGIEAETLGERAKQLDERAKYVESKEAELKALLAATAASITELKSKEAGIDRKEQLLLREQEAIGKELDVLTSAGLEITRSKQYLQQKLEQIGSFEQPVQQQPAQQARQPQQRLQQPQQSPVESVEIAEEQQEQPFLPQTKQQNLFAEKGLSKTKQQPSMQELGFGAGAGVEEAQEEEGMDVQKFTGVTPATAVKEAPLEAEEGEEALTAVAPAIKTVAAPEIKEEIAKKGKLPKTKAAKKLKHDVGAKAKIKVGQRVKKGKGLQKQRPQLQTQKPQP